MANNPYVNRVVKADGTTIIDISDSTVTANDVLNSKYFYNASGQRLQGTATGGGDDFVVTLSWDDDYYSQGNGAWIPDCTINELQNAYTSGKEIAFVCETSYYPTSWFWDDDFVYSVFAEGEPNERNEKQYVFTTQGITLIWDGSLIYPNFDSPSRTYTPTTSTQTETITYNPSDYNGIDHVSVTVNPMPSGTAGTPTATKGSVSNHSVSVTPSVTNTTGYITGSTKTGTAVTVSASELVSGTYTVDSSGTKNVTNYASASVPSGTAGTPSATKGTVSNHSVSVTPSVTNSTGWITGSTKTGTAVTVSASELVSGSQTITQNGTVNVTNLAEVVVSVEGGSGGMTVATAASAIVFTDLAGEPTSFVVLSAENLTVGTPSKIAVVAYDGSTCHGQLITNTSNAQVSYTSTGPYFTYSNGTLAIVGSGADFEANQYKLIYTYGGTSSNIDTADVQVGSGATSITFTGLTDEPDYFSCIFKSNFSTSSGYQRVIAVVYDGNSTYGLEMDSGAHYSDAHWSYTYNNGSLTITSQGTNAGGYFHQPGYYQLTYGIGGTVEPTEIEVEPLSVTQNGTYTAPTGKAYSPVTVSVSGGSVNIDTKSVTNSSNQNTSISFTSMKGQPKAFFVRCTSTLSRSSSNTYYYVADMVYDGTSTVGNMHARSNGQYSNITSGYSWSYSGTTLTLSSSGARNTSPGSFYNGTYELVYIY